MFIVKDVKTYGLQQGKKRGLGRMCKEAWCVRRRCLSNVAVWCYVRVFVKRVGNTHIMRGK